MVNKILMSLFISTLFITGCSTKESLETYEPLSIAKFDPIEEYKLDLSKLDEKNEDSISGVVGSQLLANVGDDGSLNIVFDETEANAVVVYSEQWAKVADLVEISEGYRSVAVSQAELIKVQQQTIKSLQQLVLLEQQSRDIYRSNFITSNKLYLQEHKLRMREKLSNDIRFFTTSIGIIAVAML